MATKVFQVSEVNLYIKRLFREDFLLNHLQIEGEISNAKRHSSGHFYFTLKDESAAISCVLFAGYSAQSRVQLENGKKVIITGGIGIYEKTGSYQVYVREIKESGQGDLYQQLEALKQKLEQEGIFKKTKKEIPESPTSIGIVTSETGAAIQDILQIAARRNPSVQLILYPSLVQGERAGENIARGIEYFNRQKQKVDTIIVGRGGGSMEDLWAFNTEVVVRAIYHSKIPVISAVGHEVDVTLSDLVSDLRAPTPSAAAELAIPSIVNQKQMIAELHHRLRKEAMTQLLKLQREVEVSYAKLKSYHPRRKWEELSLKLMHQERELSREMHHYLKQKRWIIESLQNELMALQPDKRLGKGYVYLETSSGKAVESISEVQLGEKLKAYLGDGSLQLKVEEKTDGNEKEGKA